MTRAQRFAREWLWLMGCFAAIVCYGVYQARGGGPPTIDHWAEALMIGVVACIPAYLVVGAVRLTAWALSHVSADK